MLRPEEEALDLYTRENRFNVGLLAERLVHATRANTRFRIGYFGSSTGAAAALVAAAQLSQGIGAVVSRGGLLIVGGNDHIVIELNEMARD